MVSTSDAVGAPGGWPVAAAGTAPCRCAPAHPGSSLRQPAGTSESGSGGRRARRSADAEMSSSTRPASGSTGCDGAPPTGRRCLPAACGSWCPGRQGSPWAQPCSASRAPSPVSSRSSHPRVLSPRCPVTVLAGTDGPAASVPGVADRPVLEDAAERGGRLRSSQLLSAPFTRRARPRTHRLRKRCGYPFRRMAVRSRSSPGRSSAGDGCGGIGACVRHRGSTPAPSAGTSCWPARRWPAAWCSRLGAQPQVRPDAGTCRRPLFLPPLAGGLRRGRPAAGRHPDQPGHRHRRAAGRPRAGRLAGHDPGLHPGALRRVRVRPAPAVAVRCCGSPWR